MHRHRLATLIALTLIAGAAQAAPWTYRGSLADGGKPANGKYDIRLTLLDTGGKRTLVGPITFDNVAVTNGNFAVDVDFGVDLSNATAMRLKTEVGERGANFVALGDPSAFDPKATLAGVCWDTQGNAGTNPVTDFLGTSDSQSLVFRVNNVRRLLLDTGGNSIGGSSSNAYNVIKFGQTINSGSSAANCGAGSNELCRNETLDSFATISGGVGNTASGFATVGGGAGNDANGNAATIGGGINNTASNDSTTVAGGKLNAASSLQSTVAGGFGNVADGAWATVPGGRENCAGGEASFAGGYRAKVRVGNDPGDADCAPAASDSNGDEGAFVWSDESDQQADFVSTGPNQFAIRATGGLRWAGTGVNSTTSPAFAHQVSTAGNTCDGGSGANTRTYLNHPLLNFNPNAILVITPNYGTRSTGTSAPLDKTFGIYYNDIASVGCPAGRWVIYQMSAAASAINNGARFNVWFVIP